MKNTVHVVIYTKPNCVQCKKSVELIKDLELYYVNTYYGDKNKTNSIEDKSPDKMKRSWSIKKIDKLKKKYNIKRLPFIKIIDDINGELLEHWAGYKPDRIKYWGNYNISIKNENN